MRRIAFAVLLFVPLAAGPAFAVPCGTGLDTTNVTFRGSAADDCSGVHLGNSPNAPDFPIVVPYTGVQPWTSLLNDGGSLTIGGITFDLDVTGIDATSGTWDLTFTSDPFPVTKIFDLLVFVKASDRYADYFFDNESFTTNGLGEGTFTITFLNNGGQVPGLSHLDIAFRDAGTTPPPPPPPPGVPYPSSFLLLGTGLAATAIGSRWLK